MLAPSTLKAASCRGHNKLCWVRDDSLVLAVGNLALEVRHGTVSELIFVHMQPTNRTKAKHGLSVFFIHERVVELNLPNAVILHRGPRLGISSHCTSRAHKLSSSMLGVLLCKGICSQRAPNNYLRNGHSVCCVDNWKSREWYLLKVPYTKVYRALNVIS